MKTDRFETFFDAIIAIIITVLVLKLLQPEQATWHAVWSLNTGYLTYLLCFLVIFNIWYNDHCFFWIVDEIDNRVILAYGVLIFLISLLPYFSTWLLLNFFSLDSQVIFGLLFIVTHLVYTFTTYLICKRNPDNEILSNLDFLSLRRYVPNIIILVGIVLSCTVFVPATYISCLVSTVIWIFIVRMPNSLTENKGRFEALIDAIVAIIVTVIVLDLSMATGGSVYNLLELKLEFIAYIISFIVCFNYWVYHHYVFSRVNRINYNVVWLTGASVFILSLIPYLSKFVSENFYSIVAQSFYGLAFLLTLIFSIIMVNALNSIEGNNLEGFNRIFYMVLIIVILSFIFAYLFYPPSIIFACLISIFIVWIFKFIS